MCWRQHLSQQCSSCAHTGTQKGSQQISAQALRCTEPSSRWISSLMHTFPGINTYLPQNRHMPALKPYLLSRDNALNAVWQTTHQIQQQRVPPPANRAVIPKKTHVPASIHSTLTRRCGSAPAPTPAADTELPCQAQSPAAHTALALL